MFNREIKSNDPNTKYRLSPSEINLLIKSSIQDLENNELISFEVNDHSIECHKINIANQTYIVFPITKDEKNPFIESNLLYVAKVLKKFLKLYPERDAILLMPLLLCQCFHYTYHWMPYARRAHAVLLTVNLSLQKIELHDSQSKRNYPDACLELSRLASFSYDQAIDYHSYNVQSDQYSCGYYVYRYILAILEQGRGADLANIKMNITEGFGDKSSYLTTCVPGYEAILNSPSVIEPLDDEEFQEKTEEGFYLI